VDFTLAPANQIQLSPLLGEKISAGGTMIIQRLKFHVMGLRVKVERLGDIEDKGIDSSYFFFIYIFLNEKLKINII